MAKKSQANAIAMFASLNNYNGATSNLSKEKPVEKPDKDISIKEIEEENKALETFTNKTIEENMDTAAVSPMENVERALSTSPSLKAKVAPKKTPPKVAIKKSRAASSHTIYIKDEIWEKIVAVAHENDISASDAIEQLLSYVI